MLANSIKFKHAELYVLRSEECAKGETLVNSIKCPKVHKYIERWKAYII